MNKPYKIQPEFQNKIDSVVTQLLNVTPYFKFKKGIKGYMVNSVRGRANYPNKYFTIPIWAYNAEYNENKESNGNGYFIYYVAHELSHLISYKVYRDVCHHDYRFYRIFSEICPKEYQHFELDFRISASKYGIKKYKSNEI